MVAFRKSSTAFACLTIAVLLISAAGGLYIFIKGKRWKKLGKPSIESLILIAVTFFLCINLHLFYRPDADDSFYVSNVLLFSSSDILNSYDSSFGNPSLGTVPMYDFQIWESYLSVFARFTGISPSILCHFIMSPVLLVVTISALGTLGNTLFSDMKKTNLFVSLLLIFYLYGGYAVYSKGSFLLSRLWQGKAVYLNILLPLLIALLLRKNNKQTTLISATILAGIAMNPTSMFVMGFELIILCISSSVIKHESKQFLSILPSSVAITFFTVMIYLRTRSNSGQIEAATEVPSDLARSAFTAFMGDGKFLFILCVPLFLYFAFKGNPKEKILFVIQPIILALIIIPPPITHFIAGKITMVPSFWRLFWLLPIDFAYAVFGVKVFDRLKTLKSDSLIPGLVTTLTFTVFTSCFGTYMFSEENGFLKAENYERIKPPHLILGELIVSNDPNPIVLSEEYGASVLRQEYPSIELIYSRNQYILDLFEYRGMHNQAEDRTELMNFVNGSVISTADIQSLLTEYNVGWILIRNDDSVISLISDSDYRFFAEYEGYLLLKRTSI